MGSTVPVKVLLRLLEVEWVDVGGKDSNEISSGIKASTSNFRESSKNQHSLITFGGDFNRENSHFSGSDLKRTACNGLNDIFENKIGTVRGNPPTAPTSNRFLYSLVPEIPEKTTQNHKTEKKNTEVKK